MKLLHLYDGHYRVDWGVYSISNRKIIDKACKLNKDLIVEEIEVDANLLTLQMNIKQVEAKAKN